MGRDQRLGLLEKNSNWERFSKLGCKSMIGESLVTSLSPEDPWKEEHILSAIS